MWRGSALCWLGWAGSGCSLAPGKGDLPPSRGSCSAAQNSGRWVMPQTWGTLVSWEAHPPLTNEKTEGQRSEVSVSGFPSY